MNTKLGTTIALVAVSGVLVVGCDPGPKCLRSHTETHTTLVSTGKTLHPVITTVSVCDEYEKPKESK